MILGITPARGGSKGVYKKNIRNVAGKPLIAWTIESALKSKHLDSYVVSTEDPEIAQISAELGAEIVDRPAELATDSATTLSVMQHAVELTGADIVVLLQCTSPVREPGLIDRCIEHFLETGADSAATGYMSNIFEWGTYSARRQDLKEFFHDDGSVYVIKGELIQKGILWGEKMERVLTTREQNFEIDDEFDLWLNEQILLKRTQKGNE